MTEDQIEQVVERHMNSLDSQLLKGAITDEEYNQEIRELDKWARQQYLAQNIAG
jgi:uncharacterized membrane protein